MALPLPAAGAPAGGDAQPGALVRCLGTAGALFLTLSAATPASSVFVIVPGMLRAAGTGALPALLLAGLVCVATAFIYAELGSAWPLAGGEYVMVARTLGPLAGFVILGVNLVNNLLFAPVAALGLADVLARVSPGLPPVPVALAVLALATAAGLLNLRLNAAATGVVVLVELAALAVPAWLGLAHPARGLAAALLHPAVPQARALAPATPAAIGLATTIGVFALNGYGMAVYFGEELHEAPRRIARVILVALGLTLLAEALPVAAVLAGAPDLPALFAAGDPFGGFVARAAGAAAGDWIALGVAVAIVNAVIVTVLASARFFWATARDRSWGGGLDARLALVHPRLGGPWAATLLVGATGAACCFLPLDLLLVLSGAGLVATYAALAVAALVGRRGASAHAPYRMPLFPLAPLVTLAALGYVVWTNWADPDAGRPGLLATAAQMLLAAIWYGVVVRRRGGWAPHALPPASPPR